MGHERPTHASFLMPHAPLFFLAHPGPHHLHAREVLTWWSWEPLVVALLIASATLYIIGMVRIGHASVWQSIAFFGGWIALVIALVSPVDTLGEILFSAHMVQHELLMIIAAPLLVLGRPFILWMWAMPATWRGPIARFMTAPFVAVIAHALALWIWHLPSLYEATLRSESIHALQHTSFIVTAALFWWALVHGRYGRLGYGAAVFYVFITSIHSGALGALLTLSPNLWYPIYAKTTTAWGLDPIEDQQLAGLIMWIPAGVILVVLGLALFMAWLAEAERRVTVAEKR